jgi:hypothetical protein
MDGDAAALESQGAGGEVAQRGARSTFFDEVRARSDCWVQVVEPGSQGEAVVLAQRYPAQAGTGGPARAYLPADVRSEKGLSPADVRGVGVRARDGVSSCSRVWAA